MADVKGAIKASLVGTSAPEPPITKQIQSHFLQHARTDEKTGELYMTEEDFINAVAPKYEDYVSGDDLDSVVKLQIYGFPWRYVPGMRWVLTVGLLPSQISTRLNANSTGYYSE